MVSYKMVHLDIGLKHSGCLTQWSTGHGAENSRSLTQLYTETSDRTLLFHYYSGVPGHQTEHSRIWHSGVPDIGQNILGLWHSGIQRHRTEHYSSIKTQCSKYRQCIESSCLLFLFFKFMLYWCSFWVVIKNFCSILFILFISGLFYNILKTISQRSPAFWWE